MRKVARDTRQLSLISLIDSGDYQGLVEYISMIDEMRSVLGRNVDAVTQASLDQSRTKADLLFKKPTLFANAMDKSNSCLPLRIGIYSYRGDEHDY